MKTKSLSKLVVALCLISWSYSTSAQSDSIVHNSVYRNYIVHLPPSYNASNSYPLVINMHGYGSQASEQQFYAEMNGVADTANFIVVYPNGIAKSWNSGQNWSYVPGINDVTFISALIDTMVTDFSIDTTRVYACGMSNGGYMSYRLACELEDKIAAIASVTGVMSDSVYNSCQADRPVPILHMHGTADTTVAYTGTPGNTAVETGIAWWVANNNCAITPILTTIPDIDPSDNSTVVKYTYGPCDDSSEVILFKITGGEHTWPGVSFIAIGITNQDIDGSGEAWKFFRRHTLGAITPPVSQEELTAKQAITIWPNPSSNTVYIGGTNSQSEISIINMLGQAVEGTKILNAGTAVVTMDITDLSDGMYLIKVTDPITIESDQGFSQILIKQ